MDVMSERVTPLDATEMPLPMGVLASTGHLLPSFDRRALEHIEPAVNEILHRVSSNDANDFLRVADIDPNNLADAGWGIVFSRNTDPAVHKALEPLIKHRHHQVSDARLFKVFDGPTAYRSGDTVTSWLSRSSVELAQVDPFQGVPLHLAIVGSPEQIPFEFQYLLDTYWSVGRLCFDTPTEYAAYAEQVVDYETAATVPHAKQVAVFGVKNTGDRATALFMNQVVAPFLDGKNSGTPLGQRQGFRLHAFVGRDASRENLELLLRGRIRGGPPALLFTSSHGLALEAEARNQRERQGAIVCSEWSGGPVSPSMAFGASDMSSNLNLRGVIHFLAASYGGGCPEFDVYHSASDGKPRRVASRPFAARLPQRMLCSGALAVLAPIDRIWVYSPVERIAPLVQEFRDVMITIMRGWRVGQCTDQLNFRWAVLSADLLAAQRRHGFSDADLANRWVARNEARNYILFGDPAVRLRVESMTA